MKERNKKMKERNKKWKKETRNERKKQEDEKTKCLWYHTYNNNQYKEYNNNKLSFINEWILFFYYNHYNFINPENNSIHQLNLLIQFITLIY